MRSDESLREFTKKKLRTKEIKSDRRANRFIFTLKKLQHNRHDAETFFQLRIPSILVES